MGSKSSSRGGVQYFPGQEKAVAAVFAPGGPFDRLLAGEPTVNQERALNRAEERISRHSARAGLDPQSGLALQAQQQAALQGSMGIADQQLGFLHQFMQPAGSASKSSSKGGPLAGLAFG